MEILYKSVFLLVFCWQFDVLIAEKTKCLVGHVPTDRTFDLRRFSGTWYMLSMLEGTADFDNAIINFVYRSDQLMSSYFVAAKGKTCQPEIPGSWHVGNIPGDMFTDYGQVAGPAKIVYVNAAYTYATIYQCFHVNADGTCAVTFVDYIGRTPTLPAAVKGELSTHLDGMCVQAGQFLDMSPRVPRCLRQKMQEYRRLDGFMADAPAPGVERPSYADARLIHTLTDSDRIVPRTDAQSRSARSLVLQPGDNQGVLAERQKRKDPPVVLRDDEHTVERLLQIEDVDITKRSLGQLPKLGPIGAEIPPDVSNSGVGTKWTKGVICAEVMCPDPCTNRLLTVDPFGCTTCSCEDDEDADKAANRTPGKGHSQHDIEDEEDAKLNEHSAPLAADVGTTKVPCATPMCSDRCLHGYIYNAEGCMTCQCKNSKEPVGLQQRPTEGSGELPSLIIEVEDDDENEEPCAIPMCLQECPDGYKHTPKGCMTCTCLDPLAEIPSAKFKAVSPGVGEIREPGIDLQEVPKLETVNFDCPIPLCAERCEHGYVYTERGCMTCKCKAAPSPLRGMCTPDNIPAVSDLNLQKMSGTWYIVSMLEETAQFSSATIYLHVRNDSYVVSFFAASQGTNCFPTQRGSWTRDNTNRGSFIADYGQNKGPLHVLYVDPEYRYAMTYQCFSISSRDGTCEKPYVDLIARTPHIPEVARRQILTHAQKACADPQDFVQLQQTVNCSITLPASLTRTCRVEDFNSVSNLDWNRMLGHWYTVVQPIDGEDLHAGEYLLKAEHNGVVSIIFHAYRDGECIQPRRATIYPNPSNPGQMTIQVGHSKTEGRIIFTDYTSMVFYQCGKVTSSGQCASGHDTVEVLHRQRRPTRHLVNYSSIIDTLCISADRLQNVSHDVTCPIKDFCKVEDVAAQANFDLTKFSGRWYTMATLATDMTWDYVTAVFARESPRMTSVWYTGSKDGQCLPTARAVIKSSPAYRNMTMDFGRASATFKVLFSDYSRYAVTWECERKSRDGHCVSGAEHLEVLSRREGETLTEQLLEQLAPYLSTACKQKEDLRATHKQLDCPIRRPASSCKFEYLKTPDKFNLKKFVGIWYIIAKNKRDSGITSAYVETTLSDDLTTLESVLHVARRGRCLTGDKKFLTVNPSNHADFISNHGRYLDRARIVYVTPAYDAAVIYACDLDAGDGSCSEGHAKVSILSRSQEITAEAKVKITEVLLSTCVQPADMHDMMHTGQCLPEDQGSRTPRPQAPSTLTSSVPAMKKLQSKQFLGRWYLRVRVQGSPTLDGDGIMDLTVGADGSSLSAMYYGSRRGSCVRPVHSGWRLRSTDLLSDFDVTSAGGTGRVKVINTDYNYALVYECHKLKPDGLKCLEGQESVDWYSRTLAPVPSEKQREYFTFGQAIGVPRSKMRRVRHRLNCTEVHNGTCSLDAIPVVSQVDIPRLMGTWYSSSRVSTAPSWHAGVVNFEILEDGTILAKYSGTRKGKCMKGTTAVLTPKAGRAEFQKENGGVVKLVYTNYEHALIYDCDVIVNNTLCDPDHMTAGILSRSPEPLPSSVMTVLSPFLKVMCLNDTDFVATVADADCTETLFEQEECSVKMEDITIQRHFDVNSLLGEWYGYAHTNGADSLASTKNLLSRDEQGNLKVYHTGSRSGKCVAPREATLEVSDSNPSLFTIYHNGKREHALILHVAPDELVIYGCYLKLADGTCAPEHTTLEIYRRRQNMLAGMSPRVRQAVQRACFNPAQFTLTIHDVDCPLTIPHDSCDFADVPMDGNFDIRAATGHWYTVSRLTPRGDLKRKSSRNYITYKSRDELSITWTAKMDKRCVTKKHGTMVAIPNDHAGIFRTTFGSWTSITKFIHLSDNYAITYECVQPTLAGGATNHHDVIVSACPLSEAEVEIYSRRPTTPQTAINVLKDILRQKTCIDVNRMDDMLPSDTCNLHAREEKSCKVDEIPIHPNITMSMLDGPWFQISATNTSSILPLYHGELFLDISESHKGWIALYMRGKVGPGSEICGPVHRVQAYSSTLDRAHWLFMTVNSAAMASGTLKIVYVDSNLLILHTCLGESPVFNALCDSNREAVQVYSHRRYLNQYDKHTVRNIIRHKLCIDERDLQHPGHTARKPASCKVDDYHTQKDFQFSKFEGTWYEVERTRFSRTNMWESLVTHATLDSADVLTFSHAGSRNGECVGPLRAHLTTAGRRDSKGDLTMWMGPRSLVGSPWSLHFPFKVIWTDYEMAIVYTCHQVADSGRCRHHAEHVHVISRTREVSTRARLGIYHVISQHLCVDVVDLVEPHHEVNCLSVFGVKMPTRTISSTAQPATCTPVVCTVRCDHGFARNALGCEICQCRHTGLDPSADSVETQHEDDGSGEEDSLDERGVINNGNPPLSHVIQDGDLDEDEVAPRSKKMGITETPNIHCAAIECQKQCDYGYTTDSRGCNMCECQHNLKGTESSCPPTMCIFLYCPHGFKIDKNGCTVCACATHIPGSENHDSAEASVRLFWVDKGMGKYSMRRAIVEPYSVENKPSSNSDDNLVADSTDKVSSGRASKHKKTIGVNFAGSRRVLKPEPEMAIVKFEKEEAKTPKQEVTATAAPSGEGTAKTANTRTTQKTIQNTITNATSYQSLLDRLLSYI